jgi:hypothetical protein
MLKFCMNLVRDVIGGDAKLEYRDGPHTSVSGQCLDLHKKK